MSVSVTFRISDDLALRLEARCTIRKQGKTEVLVEAIERGWDALGVSGEPVNTAPYSPTSTKAALLAAIPGLKTAATIDDDPFVPLTHPSPVIQPLAPCTYRETIRETGAVHACALTQDHRGPHRIGPKIAEAWD